MVLLLYPFERCSDKPATLKAVDKSLPEIRSQRTGICASRPWPVEAPQSENSSGNCIQWHSGVICWLGRKVDNSISGLTAVKRLLLPTRCFGLRFKSGAHARDLSREELILHLRHQGWKCVQASVIPFELSEPRRETQGAPFNRASSHGGPFASSAQLILTGNS